MSQITVTSPDLDRVLEGAQVNDALIGKLAEELAESEVRFDEWVRQGNFGAVVRHRRKFPALRRADGSIIAEAQVDGPLPVKTGRYVAGWIFRIRRRLNAVVKTQVPYAEWTRKAGERAGTASAKVEDFILADWRKVGERMAAIIERHVA